MVRVMSAGSQILFCSWSQGGGGGGGGRGSSHEGWDEQVRIAEAVRLERDRRPDPGNFNFNLIGG